MDCPKCHTRTLELKDLFFYIKSNVEIFLSVKPELKEITFQTKKLIEERESQKKVRVKCGVCSGNLGCSIPFGPGGKMFVAFGCDKVKLNGRKFGKKERWRILYKEFKVIETRDPSTFFNVLDVEESVETKKISVIKQDIVFPSLQNLQHFEWFSVSLVKKPRQYQIEAFIEVLQRNLVVVLKTGSGKTLIASMFLARMCSLNPEKLGLMIVDRIPLAFQQGDAIHADTKLRVAKICGENKTAYKIQQINNMRFDVLVVTAGAFYEMVQRKMIDINLFCAVVFDECHHLTGGHRYVDVLQLFTKQNVLYQPRILGLTASPVNGKTLIQCQNRLEEFLKSFPNVKIFSPRLPTSDQKVETITMKRTSAQNEFIAIVFDQFMKYCKCISDLVKIKDIEPLKMTLLNAHHVLGDLRGIDSEYGDKFKDLEQLVKEAKLLLETMVTADILGTEYGLKILESEDKFSWLCRGQHKEISNRLQKLITTIRDMSKESKILIFVRTRSICTILTKRLQEEFPELHPDRVVGHGGYDGMDWEFDQKGKLEKFSTGKCNVLVCTSVLEEGLDVATCDLVVCFTDVQSLIKFIQAKGRARKQGSRFYIYNSQATVNTNSDLRLQEQKMLAVMRQKESSCALFSELSKEIMRKIQAEMEKDDQLSSLKEKQFSILGDGLDSDFSFVVYCDPVKGINPNEIKTKLLEDLQECEEFVVNRLILLSEENKKVYSLPKRLFSEETCVFLVSVKCHSNSQPPDTYAAFCNVFPYSIQLDRSTILPVWSKAKFPVQPLTGNGQVTCTNLQMGYFTDKKTFIKKFHCDQIVDIKFEEKDIKFSYDDENSPGTAFFNPQKHAIIPLTSIENFVLLSSTPSSVSLAVPLKHPPFMKRDVLNKEVRASIMNYDPIMMALADYSVLVLNFEFCDLYQLTNVLDNVCPVPYYNVSLKIKDETNIESHVQDFSALPRLDDALWSLQCLKDSRSFCFPPSLQEQTVNVIMSKRDPQDKYLIDKVVQKSCSNQCLPFFYGFDRNLNEAYNAFAAVPKNRRHFLEDVIPKGHHLIKRAFITPLRIVHLPSVPVASNRLLRMLVDTKYPLVIVTFRDEDSSKLQDSKILNRFEHIVENGVELNGKQYHFLCSTGSQLREHKGYYVSTPTYQEILEIRKMIIPDPTQFTSVAKYFSRLGLYGTADKPICNINFTTNCQMIDDLKARDGNLFTDGAGKISHTMARRLMEKLPGDLKDIPSAFQIRYSGFKGIVVATSDDDPQLNGKSFAFRPSMDKFRNKDESLCVCSYSRLLNLSLNREIITLLCSIPIEWGLNTTLLNYQEAAIARYSNMFNEQSIAFNELRNFLTTRDVDEIQDSEMELIDEKYWISILQGIYRLRTREIRTRTNIPLNIQTQGCLIMGVPDPYGVLEEDEVYVQLKEGKRINRVLEGPLLVFRNPCLHPGDCPTLKAVNKKELKHLYNVIVFPVKGLQSIPATCSGGDLDGDLYAVIWDPDLIPPAGSGHAACDYSDLATPNEPLEPDNVTSQATLARFFGKFMSNDCLGRVATKHLSICDQLDDGARDPLAITLSKAQSQAVDFPKTGILPQWPKQLLFEYKSFPDFMEKSLKESYQSKKILGDLYRRCRSLVYNFENANSTGRPNVLLNMSLWVQGQEEYLEDAANVYVSYACDMDMLMRKFELKVEADIILGQATFGWSQHLEADKGKAANAVEATYKAIVEKYRVIFFSDVSTEDEKRMKASAWYRIVNDPEIKINKRKADAVLYLSFPWVITDILCEIRKAGERTNISRRLVNIGETALQLFKKNSPQLCRTIIEKIKKAQHIEKSVNDFMKKVYKINKGVFLIEPYGSTSMYLCETDSDIDVCILPKKLNKLLEIKSLFPRPDEFKKLSPTEQQKFFLGNIISRAVDTVTSSKKDLLEAKVPIIKCTFQDGDKEILCDISMNEIGYRKTLYVHHLYEEDPIMLPVFWILVRWARLSGFIRSTISSDKRMDSADFYALVIHILQLPEMVEMSISKTTRWSGIKYLNQQLDQVGIESLYELGKNIFEFFRIVSTLEADNMELRWPAPGIPRVYLDKSQVEDVKKLAAMAYHALSATRDVNTLLNYFLVTSKKNTSIRKTLPLNVSYAIGKARSFHAARLSEISGALVTLEVKDGKDNFELRAEGSRMSIENLLNEMKTLVTNNKALVLGRLPMKSSRYFMEGSSIFLVRLNTDLSAVLKFENSFGAFELHHNAHQRSAVHVTQTNCEGEDWGEDCVERLTNHLLQQFQKFPTGDGPRATDLLNGLEVTVRFGCFYLVDIGAHLPDSQTSIQIQELQFSVEKGRRSRKAWSRGEFRANDNLFAQPKVNTPTPSFRMVDIRPGGARDVEEGALQRIKRNVAKNKRSKRGIAAAFTPGVLKSNTTDESARRTALECYRQLVNQCGFRSGQCTRRSPPPFWRVSVNPSTSYEAQINYDHDFNVIKVTERPLNWVHGTILDGRKQEFTGKLRSNPDVRLLMSTEEKIKEGSDLYRSVFPGRENPVIIRNGKPSVPQFVLSGTQKMKKNFVSMVRNVQHTELYTNGTCDACIVYGTIYFGKELTITRPFCELSLYFDTQPLRDCIKGDLNNETLENYVRTLFKTSNELKEKLDLLISNPS